MNSSLAEYHDAIATYAALGWHVFPCHTVDNGRCTCGNPACGSPGKHPLAQLVPHGHADATTDRRIIEEWWISWPDANIGIRTGAISGLVVQDVDAGNGGWESIEALESEHGATPVTPTVETGGGGAHVFYRHPGRLISNSAGKIAPGIDIRADGGYIIAPPSRHFSGETYAWVDGFSPDDVPLADLPSWLLAPDIRQGESPRLADDELITKGGRNDRLMRVGAAFRRYGLTETEIAAALHVVNRTRCRPPLDESEVGRIAASVARYEPEPRRKGVLKFSKKKPRISVVGGEVVAS